MSHWREWASPYIPTFFGTKMVQRRVCPILNYGVEGVIILGPLNKGLRRRLEVSCYSLMCVSRLFLLCNAPELLPWERLSILFFNKWKSRSLLHSHDCPFFSLNLPHSGIKWRDGGDATIHTQTNRFPYNLNHSQLNLVTK